MLYPLTNKIKITQYFGENSEFYTSLGLAGHNGIDFSTVIGTPVIAVDNGNVLWIKDEGDFGLHIKLEHKHGWTLYAHLSYVKVVTGQQVSIGEEIALSGNTGLSRGPHLHFGYKPKQFNYNNGYYGYIDPIPYLAKGELS